jgi:glycerophosphoryl diester phosphodiesterase
MPTYEIVAHRGARERWPENTLPGFEEALHIGADAVELDVRLTKDRIPVVYHYTYLESNTSLTGPIFSYRLEDLRHAVLFRADGSPGQGCGISTFEEVLEALAGRIGLEIDVKGPEPECVDIVAEVLHRYRQFWETMEITSYEASLLHDIQRRCPGLATDLLFPRSESWMRLDAVEYYALHHARLACARAVHLHPTQLTHEAVETMRQHAIEVHMWDANDEAAWQLAADLGIPKVCTDRPREALHFREK